MNTLLDLSYVKEYRLMFLSRYDGSQLNLITSLLGKEAVYWTYLWMKEATSYLDRSVTEELFNKAIKSKSFDLIRNNYVNKTNLTTPERLFISGDFQEYLNEIVKQKTIKKPKPSTIKASLLNILKAILFNI